MMKNKLLLSSLLVLVIVDCIYLIALYFLEWQFNTIYQIALQLLVSISVIGISSYLLYQEKQAEEHALENTENNINPKRVLLQPKENAESVLSGNQIYKNSQTSDQLLVNYFPDFLCIKDHEGRWLAANYTYLSMFNLEQADYWGKTDQELITLYPNSNTDQLRTSIIQDKSAWHQRCALTETRQVSAEGKSAEMWILTRTPIFDRQQNRLKLLVTGHFVNDDVQASARLNRMADAFNEGHLSFAFLDRNFIVTDINSTFSQLTGYYADEIEGKPLAFVIDGKLEINHTDFFRDNNKQCWSKELRCKRKDGGLFPLKLDITAIIKENKPVTYFASLLDITRQKQVEKRIMQLSYYDDLTGLPNRIMFVDRLSRVVSAPAESNTYSVILFIDLDRFKAVNDSLGHDTGNALLKETAKRLIPLLRKGDLIARFNTDEFAILMNSESSYQQASYSATLLAEKIIQVLSAEFSVYYNKRPRSVFVSASIGLVVYPEDGISAEMLLKNADIAMYKAKREGGNNYQFYKKNNSISAQERLDTEADLRKAIGKGELQLYYQPQYGAVNREICGAEVLIRWFRDGKMVPPDYFIYIAEETDLIIEMGHWILRTACQKMKQWLVMGYPLPRVSVNVSARQFTDVNFLKYVAEALKDTKLEPHYLELEITESTLVGDIKRIELQLQRLKKMGVHIALDDFGTGYSSLSYLKNFPIDMLKIDKSFIMEMTKDSKDAQIARAIIEMGHSLGQKIIAEGVETEDQLLYLAHRGCDIIQGYYFSPPLSAEKMTVLLREEAEGIGAAKRKSKNLFE